MSDYDDVKEINDQIFGLIVIEPYARVIIDTVEFQRLRWIWQLGLSPLIFPTANHTRFEHSIGTYYLASKLIKKLRQQTIDEGITEIEITQSDVISVELAALCHDIGHGPFSHFWDSVVVERLSKIKNIGVKKICHEDLFEDMWKIIKVNNPRIAEVLLKYGIDEAAEKRIVRLVQGYKDPVKDKGKEILFQIVSNEKSGLDVDKMDYLARDSYNLGLSSTDYKGEINRILHYSRAIKTESGIWEVAFRDKEQLSVLGVFQMRNLLHRRAYQHKTCKALEEMMYDGIKYCLDNNIGLTYQDVNDPQWLLRNTDSLFWQLYHLSHCDIFKRILLRDLYKMKMTAYRKVHDLVDVNDLADFLATNASDIDVDSYRINASKFSLGNKSFHPLSQIHFFDKNNAIVKDIDFERFSGKSDETYKESELRIYWTRIIPLEHEEKLKCLFKQWCDKNDFIM